MNCLGRCFDIFVLVMKYKKSVSRLSQNHYESLGQAEQGYPTTLGSSFQPNQRFGKARKGLQFPKTASLVAVRRRRNSLCFIKRRKGEFFVLKGRIKTTSSTGGLLTPKRGTEQISSHHTHCNPSTGHNIIFVLSAPIDVLYHIWACLKLARFIVAPLVFAPVEPGVYFHV